MSPVEQKDQAPLAPVEQDPRWRRVLGRDAGADDAFVYAVATTGVYCRPSCPSRRPKPNHVTFFASLAEAEAAGFRACLRCSPQAESAAQKRARAAARACRMIETAEQAPGLAALAAAAGLSPSHFRRQFKAAVGLTPKAYGAACRAGRMREELARAGGGVTKAIYQSGYASSSRFYENSGEILGMTPGAFRDGGRNETIRFAIGECSLGAILVARSDKGVCAIMLGDDPDALAQALQDRFRNAELIGADAGFAEIVASVVGFVEAPQIGLDLALDLRGTAFQHRVWQALRKIPPGETVSYAEIARRIGAPTSSRAVAQACGANAVALAIPCHRVVRTGGALSGYRWGAERKRALIEREAAGDPQKNRRRGE